MPRPYQKLHPYPGQKPYTLGEAGENGTLVQIKCNLCHRTNYYLAADLGAIYGPDQPAYDPPFPCTKCDTDTYMHVTLRSPENGDYGNLAIRRPGEIKRIQTWQSVKLGDDVEQ